MTPACFAAGAVEIFGQSHGKEVDQCFFICTSTGQTYGLSAQNPMVLKTWVAALNDLIGNYVGQLEGKPTVEKAGWLSKEGQRRWYLIRNDYLIWFEQEQPADHCGAAQNSVHLAGCAVDAAKDQDTAIVVNTDRQAKGKYLLVCQTVNERREWMTVLQEAISQANYNRMKELEAPTRAGWLTVKGTRHWCQLKNDYLMWYPSDPLEDKATISAKVGTRLFGRPEEKKGVKLKGSIVLTGCTVSPIDSTTFAVQTPTTEPPEVTLWSGDISRVIQKRKDDNRKHVLLSQMYFEQFWTLFSQPPFAALTTLCKVFENAELITAITNLFTAKDRTLVLELLDEVMSAEIATTIQATTLFRTDSVATKMVRAFLKDVASGYLKETVLPGVMTVSKNPIGYELDVGKLQPGENLAANRQNLEEKAQLVLDRILASGPQVPGIVQRFLACVRAAVGRKFPESQLKALNGFFFLRFLCPAIFTPEGFGLVAEPPKPDARRALTLVAKVIQNTANETKFGGKEEFMSELNPFVETNKDKIAQFLDGISKSGRPASPGPAPSPATLQKDLALVLQHCIAQSANWEPMLKNSHPSEASALTALLSKPVTSS